jgi:Domain of unknown function (DUF6894)
MPRYFFVLHGPGDEQHDDRQGTVFAGRGDAISYGKRIVRELREAGGYGPGWILIITDGAGEQIALLPVAGASRGD